MAVIEPKGIIVHSMGEYLQWEGEWLTAHEFLKKLRLSVHGFVHPDGTYEKMIESPGKAAHAGKSKFGDLQHLNSHFLGFELLVPGKQDYASFSKAIETPGTYTDEQFDRAVEVCKWWMNQYNIPADAVVRHSDVSGDDVRGAGKGKTDPGSAFDWEAFKAALVA
jgi:N-acetyl-anhydromuramyl-L-alanine amidase AmpD